MEEPPLNAAHAYAAQAEEYSARGLHDKAAEAHRKAAENYLKAQENTENPEALQALSLLHAQHLSKHQHYSSLPKPSTSQRQQATSQRQHTRPKPPSRQRPIPKAFHSVNSSTASITSTLAQARAPPIREDGSLLLVQQPNKRYQYPSRIPDRAGTPSSQDSNATSLSNSTTSSASTDPFDRFYSSLQEMLSKLSHPLAFAMAPLDGTPMPEYGQESFLVVSGEDAPGAGNGMGDTIVPITRSMAATMISTPAPQPQQPSESRKTLEEYTIENQQLKIAVDQLSRKVASYKETAISSSSLLKNSLVHLRAVQHQQQQQQTSSAQSSRIKELEEEVKRLTMENLKVKADLEKAQRRWERLKEGARRRRREGNTGTTNGVGIPGSIPESAEEKD